ncbi:MAG: HDOD domain-containing protein [Burkholderiaceae bacterium]|nr:HDOD domain-containing protein [Burkholderiaceae bacterium]
MAEADRTEFVELAESAQQEKETGEPRAIDSFIWAHESELPDARRDALMSVIGGIPCPPQSLHQLLAPDFFDRIGPAELTELLRGEPLIAAKVLATVNAPFYGLSQPVTHIEHAVAFLGMETVRNICVQYLLAQAFKPELSSSQRSFDTIWRASSIASELALRLGKALNLPDYGSLATKVVLAFVGHLATAALLPRNAVDEWLMRSRMERAQIEQEVIGLSAGEIGTLVLRLWALPGGLVNDVSDASRVLVTPASAVAPHSVPYLGLSYLCVGLGERLALGDMFALVGYDPTDDCADENFYLRSYLQDPALARLNDALNSPELVAVVQQMRGTGASWP